MNGSKRLWQAVIVLGVLLALMALGLVGTAYAEEGAPVIVMEGSAGVVVGQSTETITFAHGATARPARIH